MQDVVTIWKTPTAQLAMFVCAEKVYGIAIAYAFADTTTIWCKALSWWAQYNKRYAYCKKPEKDLMLKGWIQNTL